MKTELVIDEDLKEYLIEENNDDTLGYHIVNFNRQWVFKFKNRYGASVIKHFRFLWI